jgi:hypothetical protein
MDQRACVLGACANNVNHRLLSDGTLTCSLFCHDLASEADLPAQ